MLDWQRFTEPNAAHLFTYFLLVANAIERDWQSYHIKRGELITSLIWRRKAEFLKIKRTMERIGKIIRGAEKNFTGIKIVNYDVYQDKDPYKTSD